tara:strand:- start:34 stop:291 length:258 start_codon:yes stop_codon:yes gene_type:complete
LVDRQLALQFPLQEFTAGIPGKRFIKHPDVPWNFMFSHPGAAESANLFSSCWWLLSAVYGNADFFTKSIIGDSEDTAFGDLIHLE